MAMAAFILRARPKRWRGRLCDRQRELLSFPRHEAQGQTLLRRPLPWIATLQVH